MLIGSDLVVKVKSKATAIDGISDASLSISGESIDITTLADMYKRRVQGLKDHSISMSGHMVFGDTDGQDHLRAAAISGDSVEIQYLFDGSRGYGGNYLVSFETSGASGGKQSASYSLEGTGPLTIV